MVKSYSKLIPTSMFHTSASLLAKLLRSSRQAQSRLMSKGSLKLLNFFPKKWLRWLLLRTRNSFLASSSAITTISSNSRRKSRPQGASVPKTSVWSKGWRTDIGTHFGGACILGPERILLVPAWRQQGGIEHEPEVESEDTECGEERKEFNGLDGKGASTRKAEKTNL